MEGCVRPVGPADGGKELAVKETSFAPWKESRDEPWSFCPVGETHGEVHSPSREGEAVSSRQGDPEKEEEPHTSH